jgi:hypothetical protein
MRGVQGKGCDGRSGRIGVLWCFFSSLFYGSVWGLLSLTKQDAYFAVDAYLQG